MNKKIIYKILSFLIFILLGISTIGAVYLYKDLVNRSSFSPEALIKFIGSVLLIIGLFIGLFFCLIKNIGDK